MATAYIRQYVESDVPVEPGITQEAVTTSGTSAQSAAFNAQASMIAIATPAAQAVCCLFGSNPTATTSHLRLPANGLYFFRVSPGQKVALIDVT
jgi:hypothetical protein